MVSNQDKKPFDIRALGVQIIKFFVVGVLNTLVDFAVFNAFIYFSGISSGIWVIVFNSISFVAAVTNSYFLNKYWTFASSSGAKAKEAGQFVAVSVGGWILNTGVVYIFTLLAHPAFISPALWINIGKVAATGVTFIWNFLGYKLFVFKK